MLLVKNDPCGLVPSLGFSSSFPISFHSPWRFFVSYYFKGFFMLYQYLHSEPFWLYYWLFFALHVRSSMENEWIGIVSTYPISKGEISISDSLRRVVGVGEKDQKGIWEWNLVHDIHTWLSKTVSFSLFSCIHHWNLDRRCIIKTYSRYVISRVYHHVYLLSVARIGIWFLCKSTFLCEIIDGSMATVATEDSLTAKMFQWEANF